MANSYLKNRNPNPSPDPNQLKPTLINPNPHPHPKHNPNLESKLDFGRSFSGWGPDLNYTRKVCDSGYV